MGRSALREAGALLTKSERRMVVLALRYAFGQSDEDRSCLPTQSDAKWQRDGREAYRIINGLKQGWEFKKKGEK